MDKVILKNGFKHFKLIIIHKIEVYKACAAGGHYWTGVVHDLSKFSPSEFWESARYYRGNGSPITIAREENGYSKAWLHHKGHNPHHLEYWHDSQIKDYGCAVIPWRYLRELFCDWIGAGRAYARNSKSVWTMEGADAYWQKLRQKCLIHPYTKKMIDILYQDSLEKGIDHVLKTIDDYALIYEKIKKEEI